MQTKTLQYQCSLVKKSTKTINKLEKNISDSYEVRQMVKHNDISIFCKTRLRLYYY